MTASCDTRRAPARRRRGLPVGVVVGVVALVATGCSGEGDQTTADPGATTGATTPAESVERTFETVVARVRPSVVEIATDSGLGSGVMYDDAGNIVTNAHVVGDATAFKVALADGRVLEGSLVGTYAPDDLAVVRVKGAKNLRPATFGDSSRVRVGQMVLAIGNPLGLESSVTNGIVSFNGRTVSEGNGVLLPSTIQTSAPINPGNSGGALVDLDGAVVGIPTLAATQPSGGLAAGIGFAVPSNTVKSIAQQLVRDGRVTDSGRAALGVAVSEVVDSSGEPAGVLVRDLTPNSSAAKAGIKPGDVIVSVDGKATPDLAALATVLAGLRPGDRVKVRVQDANGNQKDVEVTLGELTS